MPTDSPNSRRDPSTLPPVASSSMVTFLLVASVFGGAAAILAIPAALRSRNHEDQATDLRIDLANSKTQLEEAKNELQQSVIRTRQLESQYATIDEKAKAFLNAIEGAEDFESASELVRQWKAAQLSVSRIASILGSRPSNNLDQEVFQLKNASDELHRIRQLLNIDSGETKVSDAVRELSKTSNDLASELSSLRLELGMATQSAESTDTRLKDFEYRVLPLLGVTSPMEAKQRIESLTSNMRRLQDANDTLANENSALKSQLALAQSRDAAVNAMKSEIERYQDQVLRPLGANSAHEARQRISELSTTTQQLESSNERQFQEISRLRAKISALNSTQSLLADLQDEIETCRDRVFKPLNTESAREAAARLSQLLDESERLRLANVQLTQRVVSLTAAVEGQGAPVNQQSPVVTTLRPVMPASIPVLSTTTYYPVSAPSLIQQPVRHVIPRYPEAPRHYHTPH